MSDTEKGSIVSGGKCRGIYYGFVRQPHTMGRTPGSVEEYQISGAYKRAIARSRRMLNAADTMALKAPCYQDYLPNCAVNCDDRGEGDVMKECDVVLMLGRELGPRHAVCTSTIIAV